MVYKSLIKLLHLFFEIYQKNWFGNYKLVKKIGQGGMGEVFLAYSFKRRKKVALKILYKNIIDPKNLVQFEKEGLICEKIKHPNVIRIFDRGHLQHRYYFSMEYIDGMSLQSVIDTFTLDEKQISIIVYSLINIVTEIHKESIVHRDLKPDNIMFDNEFLVDNKNNNLDFSNYVNKNIKILDFGLAKFVDSKTLSQIDVNTGTPMFLPPECFLNKRNVDPLNDIYSIGVIFYYMLTKHFPYKVEENDIYQIMSTIMYKNPTPLNHYMPELSKDFCDFIDSLICKNPLNRLTNVNLIREYLFKKINENDSI